ncbi:MAG: anthranilate phosphoribosyltransferase [Planctomycetota bacterium]
MHETLKTAVEQLLIQIHLTDQQSHQCISAIMDGECDPVDIAAFLTAMAAKGPVSVELVGAAMAMRERATRIVTVRKPLLDTCGTGGDCLHTFNISTATAILAAACGVAVAKHGNRSVSSSSGSADVLETMGVNIAIDAAAAGRCLDEIGIAFCFAPLIHGAMKYAAPVRRQLGFPTIFNLLGPLTNPAGAEFQLLGTNSVARAFLMANALAKLQCRHAFVVCGNNELDEVSLWGVSTVLEVHHGLVHEHRWTPESFGLPECDVATLKVKSAAESAEMIRVAFRNSSSPAGAMVIANAAAALLAAERVDSLRDGVAKAQHAIDSGLAMGKLNELIAWRP